ncbi:MAG: aminotransferase class I/II-fold pyridoxal phosphate-dependent enzyme, partial [Chloroflexi bacterium]|nr:aminotransferase class I/II-fold pyridoxal phosphate-dependent enzyme [Chloroflexota bacterium]
MARHSAVNYDSFWVVPPREVPTWQVQRFRYDFGGANPGPDVMPLAELAEAARAVILEEGDLLTRYPPTYGPERLRALIVRKMGDHRGITWPTVDDVLVTNGSAQGILLGLQTLVRPGDVIVADRFFYQGAVRVFKGFGAQVATVDRDD